MKALWSVLMGVYSRWKYVEEDSAPSVSSVGRKATETPLEEIARLRKTIERERRNLKEFLRFDCRALAAPLESSIRAMESRIHALEFRKAI
ncbi:MAG: hypothetical protein EHM91_09115 [Planctomycetota bacterium]|nr:MAG: hypothetical protein EHM91_09115 [Planctomycetota bacterium]